MTISNRRGGLTRAEIKQGIELIDAHDGFETPRRRIDCEESSRPCLWVRCRYNLYLDVVNRGSIKLNFPTRDPDEMVFSCALDEAERGGMTLDMIGERMNITRERARQIQEMVLVKLRRSEHWDYLKELFRGEGELNLETVPYDGDGESP